jgi:type I restriction enzyme M protein
MAVKKSELYSSLWKSCDQLRGGMDASQYKDYVLALLFVKYVSDRYSSANSLLDVPQGGSFKDLVVLVDKKEIGDGINKVIARLAEANDLQGVIDIADFNDAEKLGKGQDMVDRLSKLVGIFNSPTLDFSRNSADGDDLLGDAYEYLMRHFATESGKSKGQFYTPAEVSRIMAKIVGVSGAINANQTIYDPTCGSGSLLLKAHDEAKATTGLDLAVYGQEMDNATAALSKMNMILHNCATAEIYQDNTLSRPEFKDESDSTKLKTFDFVVANPPFSTKSWSNGLIPLEDPYGRFKYGVPPEKNGDYAFLLHILASLKSTGKAAMILPHGVLFRGNAEAEIRKEIVRRGYIKAIIGLPGNLFYGTGIPAAIILLDRENAEKRSNIFMVDASKGFEKDGNKNRLRERDIHRIVDAVYQEVNVPGYARMVPISEIADEKNDYNLNLPRYIQSIEREDIQDLAAHLRGGIPNADIDSLDAFWKVMPELRVKLFRDSDHVGYSRLSVLPSEVLSTIQGDTGYLDCIQMAEKNYSDWLVTLETRLKGLEVGVHPKELIQEFSESLLATSKQLLLIDPYAVYQLLMSYWSATLQDDVYLISGLGWVDAAKPHTVIDSEGGVDFTIGKGKHRSDLLPANLLVATYFQSDAAAITKTETEVAEITAEIEGLIEEHAGDEGLLAEVVDEDKKIIAKALASRVKMIGNDPNCADELALLNEYSSLKAKSDQRKKTAKALAEALNGSLIKTYPSLDEGRIKVLALSKWTTTLDAAMKSERERIGQRLADRIETLGRRYETPLPVMISALEEVSTRVDKHLLHMGLSW